jgi:hypothetical protein
VSFGEDQFTVRVTVMANGTIRAVNADGWNTFRICGALALSLSDEPGGAGGPGNNCQSAPVSVLQAVFVF